MAVEVCNDEGIACRDSVVRVCDGIGRPSRTLGRCLWGCSVDVAVGDVDGIQPATGTPKNPEGVLSILCRRDHAERR
jgi:hypothetical protein